MVDITSNFIVKQKRHFCHKGNKCCYDESSWGGFLSLNFALKFNHISTPMR